MVTNPLVKEFLKSWRVLFFLFLKMLAQAKELAHCEYDIAFACFCFMFTINVNNGFLILFLFAQFSGLISDVFLVV